MDGYRETAFYLALWYAILATVAAILLIALNDVGPAFGFLIAANAALLFALVLMALVGRLNDRRIMRGLFWRALPPRIRPSGEAGLRMACRALEEIWLRFAKGAAMIAIVLSGFAYASNNVSPPAWARAVGKPAVTQPDSRGQPWTGYRSARLLPMN